MRDLEVQTIKSNELIKKIMENDPVAIRKIHWIIDKFNFITGSGYYFWLNENEAKLAEDFKRTKKACKFTYKFTPTGIGNGVEIEAHKNNKLIAKKDITDYESW